MSADRNCLQSMGIQAYIFIYASWTRTQLSAFVAYVATSCSSPAVKVQVAELLGRLLTLRHLLVVVKHPAALLLDVAHVVPASRVGAHVAHDAEQLVPPRAVRT